MSARRNVADYLRSRSPSPFSSSDEEMPEVSLPALPRRCEMMMPVLSASSVIEDMRDFLVAAAARKGQRVVIDPSAWSLVFPGSTTTIGDLVAARVDPEHIAFLFASAQANKK